MTEEERKELEDLKQTLATLSQTIKSDSENRQKQDALIEELKLKQEEYEKSKNTRRKGIFTGEEDEVRPKTPLDTLMQTKSLDDKVVELQKANDDILIVSQILGRDPRGTKIYQDFVGANKFLKEQKALYSTATGYGDEWVPTGYSRQLYDLIRLQLKVANLHTQIEMPTNPYISPVVASDSAGYLVTERTGDDDALTADYRIKASTPGTTNFTLTAKKLGARIVFSEEMVEDSIVPVLPFVRNQIVLSMATAIENAIINGDTSATHMDSDTTNSYDARKAWDGYRDAVQSSQKVALDGTKWTTDQIHAVRQTMGIRGVNPSDLVIVTGITGYLKMMTLKDDGGNQMVTTLDKYGPAATILNGELGKVWGIPIIVSELVRQNLNASGVYDTTTTTKTILLFVYKPGFVLGNRRGLTLKSAEEITTDQTMLVATQRLAFSPIHAVASNYVVALGYNIS